MLALFVVGWATLFVGVGAIPLFIVGLWALIDALLIPGMIQKHKDKVRSDLTNQALNIIGREPRREPSL